MTVLVLKSHNDIVNVYLVGGKTVKPNTSQHN